MSTRENTPPQDSYIVPTREGKTFFDLEGKETTEVVGVEVEEDKGGVMVSRREGEEKDTEVRSADRTVFDVYTTCFRVLDIG